jgi:hypothetical protein
LTFLQKKLAFECEIARNASDSEFQACQKAAAGHLEEFRTWKLLEVSVTSM